MHGVGNVYINLNGFWAFAIWDEIKKELWLSRDRFGVKPLYYLHEDGKRFVFGSETLVFKHLEDFTREADSVAVTAVIQNVSCLEAIGETIFKNIKQIKPGHDLIIT